MAINIGSWGLPEFGITELFGGKKASVAKSKNFPVTRANIHYAAAPAVNNIPYSKISSTPKTSSTLGTTSTRTTSTPTNTGGGSGGGSGTPSYDIPKDNGQSEIDAANEQLRGDISSGWDNYINGLDDQLDGLSGQRSAQEGIVGSQYQQGVNTLGLQKEQGVQSLAQNRTAAEQNQAANLRDISGNIRNAFMAGNVYLGSRGAGDSSAANQYSYALNKMGTQQRSDVMNNTANILAEVNARETNLNNIYNTEINNLEQEKNAQTQEIAAWFFDAQNQIAQMKSQGQLSKSQDLASISRTLLDNAIAKVNQLNTYALNKRQMLDQWALTNGDKITAAKTSLQSEAQYNPQLPQATNLFGNPQVSSGTQTSFYGGGGLFDNERDPNKLFGNTGNYSGWMN